MLAGYKLSKKDIVVALGKTLGENSNSDWHSDAFYPIIKGFIYLVDIVENDAPFQILKANIIYKFFI